jgi:hypothetical protein
MYFFFTQLKVGRSVIETSRRVALMQAHDAHHESNIRQDASYLSS